MDNSLADTYFERLMSTDKPLPVLIGFIRSIFDKAIIDDTIYGRLGKLVKIYGSKTVYYSILDCATLDDMDINKLLNYINYNCKRRFESKNSNTPFNDLTDMAKKIREQLESLQ